MSGPPIRRGTVALIASAIIERKMRLGILTKDDFTSFKIPGSCESYSQRTMRHAAIEAWALIEAVDEMAPLEG